MLSSIADGPIEIGGISHGSEPSQVFDAPCGKTKIDTRSIDHAKKKIIPKKPCAIFAHSGTSPKRSVSQVGLRTWSDYATRRFVLKKVVVKLSCSVRRQLRWPICTGFW
ncbi:unnamed protein product [Caenorhabditis sp. 36 PRJEB53466]|nr:unnamed protein product [Caenorhabditis sp. 36 PRJEB53466]